MHVRNIPNDKRSLHVVTWPDPVVDQVGYDTLYVERFWLGILGPSATWLLRHLANRLDASPAGYDLDLAECAHSAWAAGPAPPPPSPAPWPGAASSAPHGSTVPTPWPCGACCPAQPAADRPPPRRLQDDHAQWIDQSPTAVAEAMRERARQLALSLVELGEDGVGTERQLHRWRFHPALASEATAWALSRHAVRSGTAGPAV